MVPGARDFCNFSIKGGTRPPSPREVNSRGPSPAVGRFAPSGPPSIFPRLIEMILSFLPLQICVNPRLSAAKKSFPFFYFFVSPAFFVFLISNR